MSDNTTAAISGMGNTVAAGEEDTVDFAGGSNALASAGSFNTFDADDGGTVILGGGTTISGSAFSSDDGTGSFVTPDNQMTNLNNMTISSGATYTGEDGSNTVLSGDITDDGTLTLDSTASLTKLSTGGSVDLTGTGTITLTGPDNAILTNGTQGNTLIIGSGITVEGSGTLADTGNGGNSFDAFVINGNIIADGSTPLTLGNGVLNNGSVESTGGGVLDIGGTFLLPTVNDGVFNANGGTVNVTGAVDAGTTFEATNNGVINNDFYIFGGTLSTASGGSIDTPAGVSATLDDVIIAAGTAYLAQNGSTTLFSDTITNDGTFSLNSTGSTTRLVVGGDVSINGTGTIALSDSADNGIFTGGSFGNTLTIGAGQTVEGSGTLEDTGGGAGAFNSLVIDGNLIANGSAALTLGNGVENNGAVSVSQGSTLDITGNVTNNSTMDTAGGNIVISGSVGGSGSIDASGNTGEILVTPGGSVSGTMGVSGGATIVIEASNSSANINIGNGSSMDGSGQDANNGDWDFGSDDDGGDPSFQAIGNTTITGTGTIHLGDATQNDIYGPTGQGQTLIIGSGQTVDGVGTITDTGQGTVVNQGAIIADNALPLVFGPGAVNDGTLEANGGYLQVTDNQTGSGTAILSGTNATLEFEGSSNENTTFASGASGTLKLDDSEGFTGNLSGFTQQDGVDLADFGFSGNPAITSITGTGAAGSATDVTITDGSQSVTLALINQTANEYSLSSSAYSLTDDAGGTLFQLFQTATWGGATGNWSDGADWSGGEAPTASVNAFLGESSPYTVTVSDTEAADNLTISDAEAVLADTGSLTVSGALTNSGTLEISAGGSLSIQGPSFQNTGAIDVDGGQLLDPQGEITGSGVIDVSGSGNVLEVNNATVQLAAGASARIEGAGDTISIGGATGESFATDSNVVVESGLGGSYSVDATTVSTGASQSNYYNAEGQLLETYQKNANGSGSDAFYDISNNGALEQLRSFNADGSQTLTVYDDTQAYGWESFATQYNAAGEITSQTGTTIGGSTWSNVYNTSGSGTWQQYVDVFDASGNLVTQTGTNNNGTHWLTGNDTQDQYPWATFTIQYDADWNVASVTGTNHNGTALTNTTSVFVALDTLEWYASPNIPAGITVPPTGAAADNVFIADTGNDSFNGGAGYSTYQFGATFGQDAINNIGPDGNSPRGEIDFGSSVTDQNLWFAQSGSNLVIDLLGTSDSVTVDGWFGSNAGAQVQNINAGGLTLNTQVDQLVQAMATFATNNPGFSPTTAAQMPADSTLQNTLAAAWHH